MLTYPQDGLENFSLDKQQRVERLKWVFYGVGAMLLVICGFYMQEKVEVQTLHAYALTILVYGHLLYVEEFEHLRKQWLWNGIVATIPLHAAVVAALLRWDRTLYTGTGYALVYVLLPIVVAEVVIFGKIIDYFKAIAAPDQPRRQLTRLLTWKGKARPKPIITLADESGDDSDPSAASRSAYLQWGFWSVGTVLLTLYLLKGAFLRGASLYIVKAGLLTILSYGYLLYVEEKDDIRSHWLWASVLVALPFHIAIFGIVIAIDRAAPSLASNPVIYLAIIWAAAWLGRQLMDQIADDYRPWPPSESTQ